MFLDPGRAQHWPPGTVTAIQVSNPSAATARLALDGDAFAVAPDARADLRAAEDHEIMLANVGDVAVELSWVIGYERPQDHPDYDAAREHRLADDQREAIIDAWREAFGPANPFYLPGQFAQFDPMTLDNRSGIDLGRGFSQFCPGWKEGSTWADGNARGDLRNMTAKGLKTVKSDGDPTFADDDRSVTYRLSMDRYDLDGALYVTQSCCVGLFGWCWDTNDYENWNKFTMTLKDVVLIFDAVVVEPDGDEPLRVSVTGTRVEKRGGVELDFPSSGVPDWLKWLVANWAELSAFKIATDVAVTAHLEQGAIRTALETVMNADLQAPAVV